MTRVVNIRSNAKFDVYIGRKPRQAHHYGNPFLVGALFTQEGAVESFRKWLYGQAFKNIEPERREWIFQNMDDDLKDKVLGCYCKPLVCHGDVYVEILDQ